MKRYTMYCSECGGYNTIEIQEDKKGMWVRFEDVKRECALTEWQKGDLKRILNKIDNPGDYYALESIVKKVLGE